MQELRAYCDKLFYAWPSLTVVTGISSTPETKIGISVFAQIFGFRLQLITNWLTQNKLPDGWQSCSSNSIRQPLKDPILEFSRWEVLMLLFNSFLTRQPPYFQTFFCSWICCSLELVKCTFINCLLKCPKILKDGPLWFASLSWYIWNKESVL